MFWRLEVPPTPPPVVTQCEIAAGSLPPLVLAACPAEGKTSPWPNQQRLETAAGYRRMPQLRGFAACGMFKLHCFFEEVKVGMNRECVNDLLSRLPIAMAGIVHAKAGNATRLSIFPYTISPLAKRFLP
ncbi:hypothetical protein SD70_21000 [Gordoniibacillus kamchatkensis]|uniref:Uncharacterized protein n=1 Tax=Gordoniibacillus kamchatkensis TaxID=1590651 RepID=A0ABR5AE06_9BACL|nr:hypothetical protein [Paenibacillus sp. VKM B-2647]KIL39281.1 hypothetical protein SD70_21000 [Paenibacillus sp. VKM B-2647]